MRFNKWTVIGVSMALVGVVGGAVVAKSVHDASEGAHELRVMALGGMFNPSMFDNMNLTRVQRMQIRQILRDNRASFIPLLADAHTTGKALRDASVHGATADDLQPLATKQAQADAAVMAAVATTEAKVAAILTDDQRNQASKAIDTRIATVRGHIEAGDGPIAEALLKLGDKLNLSADQKSQARQIIAAGRTTTKPLTLQLIDKFAATQHAIAAGSYDPANAKSDASQTIDPLSTVVLTAATTREQLVALLTPTQKARLRQIMADHNWS